MTMERLKKLERDLVSKEKELQKVGVLGFLT